MTSLYAEYKDFHHYMWFPETKDQNALMTSVKSKLVGGKYVELNNLLVSMKGICLDSFTKKNAEMEQLRKLYGTTNRSVIDKV